MIISNNNNNNGSVLPLIPDFSSFGAPWQLNGLWAYTSVCVLEGLGQLPFAHDSVLWSNWPFITTMEPNETTLIKRVDI